MNRQSNQKITALYCRLAHYEKHDTLFAMYQQEELLEYAAEHGLENPQLFCDWGMSGTTFDRPQFQHVLREVKAGHVANLVVRDFSRLGRNSLDCADLIEETLPKYGVTFHSVRDGVPTPEYLAECAQMRKALLNRYRQERKGGRA